MIKSLLFLVPAFDGVEDAEPAPESPPAAAAIAAEDEEDDAEAGDTFVEDSALVAAAGSLVGE